MLLRRIRGKGFRLYAGGASSGVASLKERCTGFGPPRVNDHGIGVDVPGCPPELARTEVLLFDAENESYSRPTDYQVTRAGTL